jgi:peroxiredoxin
MNTPEQTRDWKQAQGFDYATLQDADGALGHLYGATTTPNMFVIDSQGVLRYSGAIDDDPRGRKDLPVNYVRGALVSLGEGGTPDPSQTRPYGCSVKYK